MLNDQLCYEVDVNKYKARLSSDLDIREVMNIGLFLLIDKNEEYDTREQMQYISNIR